MQQEGEEEASADREDLVEVVFVNQDGKAVMKQIKTGIQDNMFIEVTEGITMEEQVITGPYRAVSKKLKDGDEITVVDKKDLFAEEK